MESAAYPRTVWIKSKWKIIFWIGDLCIWVIFSDGFFRDSDALSMSKYKIDYSFQQHESSLDDKMELIVLELISTDWFKIMTHCQSYTFNIYQMSNKDILDD